MNTAGPSASKVPEEWLLWQLADSAFPIGGFSHSGGLESAWQHHAVRTSADLAEFLRSGIYQLAHGAIPFITGSFRGVLLGDLIGYYDAFLSNHVANRASRSQGRAFLAVATRTFPSAALLALQEQVEREQLPTHFAPLFGRVACLLDFTLASTQRLFLFTQIRAWISSAIRLSILGPLEAQELQATLYLQAEEVLAGTADLDYTNSAQTAPIFELFQGTHDRLYSRLFQS